MIDKKKIKSKMLEQVVYTACVTPFKNQEKEVDYKSLENILRIQDNAGNGILILGSTGENLSLDNSEKEKIVKFTCSLKLKSEILVGVASYNLEKSLSWIDYCNEMPINGILITTPIYTKPGILGQKSWFSHLIKRSKHDVMLYNVPGRSGAKLYPQILSDIDDNKLLAIKDASGTLESIVEYSDAKSNIAIYCGDDHMMPSAITLGAKGLISVASNIWPDLTREYVKKALRGEDFDKITWWNAAKSLFLASNPIPVKTLLAKNGIIESSDVRLPLSTDDLRSIDALLLYDEIIRKI